MSQIKNFVLTLMLFAFATAEIRADDNDAVIEKFLRDYVDAFNRQELDSVSAMWSENGVHVDRETGGRTVGRAAIRADLEEVFKQAVKIRLAGTVNHVRFVKPDVASVEGTITTIVINEEPRVSQFTAILVKQGDNWQIDSIKEAAMPLPATAYDALRELEWLEGNWVDDANDPPVISTFRWSANRSFLVRSFSIKEGTEVIPLGTQIIGWDPRSQQIRSWTFNADGSFGDGIWAKIENDWQVKSTQTTTDGGAASGTYVITPVDADMFTLRLIGQEVEGVPVPSAEPVTLVRAPDAKEPARDALQPKKQ